MSDAPLSELPTEPLASPRGDFTLRSRPPSRVTLALGFPGAAPPAGRPRRCGPGDWLLVDEDAQAPGYGLIDLTHARERIEISGPGAVRKLAAGVAVDLARLDVGESCECLYGHIAVHLTRTGAETYELLVARSFARSLWTALS
jgi:sarcosine oxidase subunit gamma